MNSISAIFNALRFIWSGALDKLQFKYVYGVFPDLNAFWFNDIGYMVSSSMIIEAIFPVIEFFFYWLLKWVKFVID